ncbi:MAG: hypothetical protein JXN61_18120, partial [Sedimentisphaerales bacterium]|nr:hypothetical protein [Sedimentisphaerales bacterium]
MNAMRIMLVLLLLLACGCSGENTNDGTGGSGDSTGLKIVAPLSGIYLGAYDWREHSTKPGVKEFEDAAGAKVALTSGGVCISREGQPFSVDAACLKRLNQKGYVVLIDVVSRNHSPQQII